MKAHDALSTAGIMTTSGERPAAIAKAAKTGIKMVDVAVFEVFASFYDSTIFVQS